MPRQNTKQIIRKSILCAISVIVYIFLVSLFMNNAQHLFGKPVDNPTTAFFTPIIILSLFVLSAAITGFLVLGIPILLYLNGNKKEAVRFFLYTLFWLFLFILSIIFFLLWITASVIAHLIAVIQIKNCKINVCKLRSSLYLW